MVYALLVVINEYDAETLDLHRQNVAEKEQALAEAKSARDEFVRSLLAKGAKPTELGRTAGLSRERVYQIKQRRR
jgi:helix-turn-helix protein